MAKKTAIKKKKSAGKKPLKKTVKPAKKVTKKKNNGIPFKVPFGNIILSGNANPTAAAPPGMAFPISYQLTFSGKNKDIIGAGQQKIGLSFTEGFWSFPGIAPEMQQQEPIKQIANSIGNAIITFFQKK